VNPPQKKSVAALALAVALAGGFEGLRNWAYLDPVGIPTICYGSIKGVRMGDYKTTEECKKLLGVEMWERIETVERCVPGLPVNMLAAWASAIFNTGNALVCDVARSTAARLLKAGKWLEACRQLPRWNKARVGGQLIELPGLTRRRAAEEALCLKP
jgi:lysozyme